jgi:hypothetical protein
MKINDSDLKQSPENCTGISNDLLNANNFSFDRKIRNATSRAWRNAEKGHFLFFTYRIIFLFP